MLALTTLQTGLVMKLTRRTGFVLLAMAASTGPADFGKGKWTRARRSAVQRSPAPRTTI